MARWNLTIPDQADRLVRMFLSRSGKRRSDLATFVVNACRREVLRRTLAEVQSHNVDLSPREAMRLAEEALAATRAARP
ncbi:MAG: ribbon-helix-helix domain-containing protein [Planctomycetota bacterium]